METQQMQCKIMVESGLLSQKYNQCTKVRVVVAEQLKL